eukprot:4366402-Amphidinium_carterae.1
MKNASQCSQYYAHGVKILLTHNGTKAAKDTKQWITMDMAAQAYASGGCVFAEVPGLANPKKE